MKKGQNLWTREELILAINIYCKIPFGKIHQRNPEIINLANLIKRTPSSVAFKMVNFASLDPSLKARGIKGASNASKLDSEIWNEFFNAWDVLPFESEKLLAKFQNTTIEKINFSEDELPKEGKTREQVVKARINQSFFRSAVLAAYDNKCCVTGINQIDLLVAGHISPWSSDEKNRLNPRNGLSMNALHDKAFEAGLMTITPDYIIKISPRILKLKDQYVSEYFSKYHNQSMIMPNRFLPDEEFLRYHNDSRFKC